MKRDLDLYRKIMIAIEDQYEPGAVNLHGLKVEGYNIRVVAEHCKLLWQAGIIESYKPIIGGDVVLQFIVGNLTHYGYDVLEQMRSDEIWNKTNKEIEEKKLPKTIEVVVELLGKFTGNVIKEIIG